MTTAPIPAESYLVQCPGAVDADGITRGCHCRFRFVAAWDWTAVEIEIELNNRIPDWRLVRDGHPIVLTEFVATNPIGWERAIDLSKLDKPTLVITADTRFFEGASTWSPETPLPVTLDVGLTALAP